MLKKHRGENFVPSLQEMSNYEDKLGGFRSECEQGGRR